MKPCGGRNKTGSQPERNTSRECNIAVVEHLGVLSLLQVTVRCAYDLYEVLLNYSVIGSAIMECFLLLNSEETILESQICVLIPVCEGCM